jgi:hypothetical protein
LGKWFVLRDIRFDLASHAMQSYKRVVCLATSAEAG